MKLTSISYRYAERRSANFQSAEVGLEATVTVEEGEDRTAVLTAIRKHVQTQVRGEVATALATITGLPIKATS